MKPVLLIPVVLSAALGNSGVVDTPTIVPEPADDLVFARAHATECTNALDGSPSQLSHSLCADGWGPTWEAASFWAIFNLATQTCLGPQWGCCQFELDQDFNTCGK